MDLNDLFNQEEERLLREARHREKSGQQAIEDAARRRRSREEYSRLVRNGCIEHQRSDEEE